MDLASVKRSADLVALVSRYTQLRRESRREWSGPCPRCGGRDRLHCTAEWFFCRRCHPKRGDAIELLMWLEGLDFKAAVERLAGMPLPAQKPAQSEREHKPYPGQDWQAKAWALVQECEAALWSAQGEWARQWLAGRGLHDVPLLAFRVGLCAGGQLHGLRLERGILIPWWQGEHIWKVNVRRPMGEPKYRALPGSVEGGLFGAQYLGCSAVLVITEGEFDAMLLWQEAGDLVDVTTAGSAAALPKSEWWPILGGYRRIWVATDHDQAGEQCAQKWLALLGGRAVRVLPPGGAKDITDAWQAKHDLRAWVNQILHSKWR